METLVINPSFWRGRRVLLTGHTGFKGSWAAMLLSALGAEVHGFALPPEQGRSLFADAEVERDIHHRVGDIRDLSEVRSVMDAVRPEIVLHMAAQALVRPSYAEPVATYATNVMGTVHVLEAARARSEVMAVVVVTSDKCYDNVGSLWGYREGDKMGGHDPYSNSKGCAELVTSSYRNSFFHLSNSARVGSARAGNVIGGGDWSVDRLVPDAMRAFLANEALWIRNPSAVRPWQHVLDPVIGYLLLAERLSDRENGKTFAEGWNFGPASASEVAVREVVDNLAKRWGASAHWKQDGGDHVHEAAYLKLDCTKASTLLGWQPLLDLERSLDLTVDWYRAFADRADLRQITLRQIDGVLQSAGC